MLMDEPFGAIDPINRERLQNEFLRLQAAIRKTIVFVTHDIDEAIKMGDRIAVLQEGGILAQYATPGGAARCTPRTRSCEDFVGADRALKRLALQRVRDVDLWKAPLVRAGEPIAEARAKIEAADIDIPLLVDADDKPVGWLSERGLSGERVREELRSGPEPIVELDDILRDALSDLLASEAQYGPVVDANGRVAGVLSIEVLAHAIATTPPEEVPTRRTWHDARSSPSWSGATAAQARRTAWRTTGSARTGSPSNFDRYVDPLVQHIYLTVVSVAIGFAIAFGLALLAHRRRWLTGPIVAGHRHPLHAAERRRLLPAAADHRPRRPDGDHRARLLHAADPVPQRDGGAGQRARRRARRRRAAWG